MRATSSFDTAFELYGKCVAEARALTSEEFEAIWNCIGAYIRSVLRRKVFGVSDFDLDDLEVEVQFRIWDRMRRGILPVDGGSRLFVGSLKRIALQTAIDSYRKESLRERSRRGYEQTAPTTVPDRTERLSSGELLSCHEQHIAWMMAERARFEVLEDQDLCEKLVTLFLTNGKRKEIAGVLESVDFWDKEFLLVYTQVLFRWCYYDFTHRMELTMPLDDIYHRNKKEFIGALRAASLVTSQYGVIPELVEIFEEQVYKFLTIFAGRTFVVPPLAELRTQLTNVAIWVALSRQPPEKRPQIERGLARRLGLKRQQVTNAFETMKTLMSNLAMEVRADGQEKEEEENT